MVIKKASLRTFFELYNQKKILESNELFMYDKEMTVEKLNERIRAFNKKCEELGKPSLKVAERKNTIPKL